VGREEKKTGREREGRADCRGRKGEGKGPHPPCKNPGSAKAHIILFIYYHCSSIYSSITHTQSTSVNKRAEQSN